MHIDSNEQHVSVILHVNTLRYKVRPEGEPNQPTDEKTDPDSSIDRQTDRQRGREIDRQTDRQTDRQREAERQIDKQTDRQRENSHEGFQFSPSSSSFPFPPPPLPPSSNASSGGTYIKQSAHAMYYTGLSPSNELSIYLQSGKVATHTVNHTGRPWGRELNWLIPATS